MRDWYKQFNPSDSEPENIEFMIKHRFRTPKGRKPPKPPLDKNDLEGAVPRIKDYLLKKGSASRRDLQTNLSRYMNTETLDRVLYVLTEIGYLEIERTVSFKTYKISPSMGKKGTPNVQS